MVVIFADTGIVVTGFVNQNSVLHRRAGAGSAARQPRLIQPQAIPVSAKITTIAIKSVIQRYASHIAICRSKCISLYMALYGDGRYVRRHRYDFVPQDVRK